MSEFLSFLQTFWTSLSPVDQVGLITGLFYIIFSVLGHAICWPFGIIATACWAYSSFTYTLYMDSVLQLYYVGVGFYGLYVWVAGGREHKPMPIHWATNRQRLKLMIIGVVLTVIFGAIYTGPYTAMCEKYGWSVPSYPWVDTVTTVFSILATWMLARKMIENWIVWLVVDPIYVWLYYKQEMNGYCFLMVVYSVLAAVGLMNWIREYSKKTEEELAVVGNSNDMIDNKESDNSI